LAWHGVSFYAEALAGKLPDLRAVIERTRTYRRKTGKAQRAQMAMWADFFGIPARPLSDAAKQALVRLKERHGGK
jgi:hypothetical protein